MTKRLLIDASHAEETRVVVLDGNRLEDFDVETAARRQIKGNIYLAKVIRVEPSLQAAFVEYGGNRHGFLAFGEIHPDYYQIPVADRQRLLAQQAREEAEYAAEADAHQPEAIQPEAIQPEANQPKAHEPEAVHSETHHPEAFHPEAHEPEASDSDHDGTRAQPLDITSIEISAAPPPEAAPEAEAELFAGGPLIVAEETEADPTAPDEPAQTDAEYAAAADPGNTIDAPEAVADAHEPPEPARDADPGDDAEDATDGDEIEAAPPPESLGGDGDDAAEAREKRQRQRFLRNYKIQEVIHRRQIMLIQVVKEERGSKGAALTTYLSLAGRFSVLMPNSPSGGGVSRKITSPADRRRLKEAMAELDIPDGMGLIVRTAGANRPKPEIKRDCEYLLRLWDDIRDKTMQSVAPALINEEASLIKRTIRDVYTRDVEEVLVDGEEGFSAAHDFMRMLMPSHAAKVKLWSEGQPLFARYQVENQLDAMLNPTVQLRSGGYIVINQTEALVAIDVNSGRSTRERNIEDTALRTNLEAAEEAARQLRMRDLAGLIVIDFIDMESRRNNTAVERRLKDALKNDRARIQIGTISHFGLMEMSRQRLRPSLAEASLMTCPHCQGMGQIRSPESAALHVLRAIEDEGAKYRSAEIAVHLVPEIALYLFNHKRDRLDLIEARYRMKVMFSGDATLTAGMFRIDKIRALTPDAPALPAPAAPVSRPQPEPPRAPEVVEEDADEPKAGDEEATAQPGETGEDADRKRRRRRRRGKRRPDGELAEPRGTPAGETPEPASAPADEPSEFDLVLAAELVEPEDIALTETSEAPPRRRRSRRRRAPGEFAPVEPAAPVYHDIADIFEAAEQAEASGRPARDIYDEAPDGPPPELARQEAEPEMDETLPRDPGADEIVEPAAPEPPSQAPELAPAAEDEAAPVTPAPHGPRVIGVDAPAAGEKKGWWRRTAPGAEPG